MDDYLRRFYDEEITNLLNDANCAANVSIQVCLTKLQRERPALFAALLRDTTTEFRRWNAALLAAQTQLLEGNAFLEPDFQIKENCQVRFVRLPAAVAALTLTATAQSTGGGGALRSVYPTNEHAGRFVQVQGSVVRLSQAKLLEQRREYVCARCKHTRTVRADYARMYAIEPPKGGCPVREGGAEKCGGQLYQRSAQPVAEHCVDVQEIRIQEVMSDRNMPASLAVTLDADLVDSCQPGDLVTICGTVELRWRPLQPGRRPDVSVALRAHSLRCEDKRQAIVSVRDMPEHLMCVRAEWQELCERDGEQRLRDEMLRSFCPEIHGMYVVKLAVLLALSSGVNGRKAAAQRQQKSTMVSTTQPPTGPATMQTRGSSHVILVGDPGLAKSKLLRFAAAVAVRSVHTTGMGCSSAGLTAAAVKENGEWQLEAGALVLADGGVCCIDEFNAMRDTDKAAIHEAMEQQTISMAKAGLVCKLSTRCIVVAATNPKNMQAMQAGSASDAELCIGIASPLLSRFDIVLVLRDERDPEWDDRVAAHLLANYMTGEDDEDEEEDEEDDHLRATTQQSAARPTWTETQFQTHLTAIRDICPTVQPGANAILGAYFRRCRADPRRDPARTTVRLLDSLMRLAHAHARLMFRDVVNEVDAVTVVRLMESSWGFGLMLPAQNVLREDLPLGPSREQVKEVKRLLGIEEEEEEKEEQVQTDEVVVDTAVPLTRTGTAGDQDMFSEYEVPQPEPDRFTFPTQKPEPERFPFATQRAREFTQLSLLTNRNFERAPGDGQSADEGELQSSLDIFNALTGGRGKRKQAVEMAPTQQSQKRTQAEIEEILSFADFEDDVDEEPEAGAEKTETISVEKPEPTSNRITNDQPRKRPLTVDNAATNEEFENPFIAAKQWKKANARANKLPVVSVKPTQRPQSEISARRDQPTLSASSSSSNSTESPLNSFPSAASISKTTTKRLSSKTINRLNMFCNQNVDERSEVTERPVASTSKQATEAIDEQATAKKNDDDSAYRSQLDLTFKSMISQRNDNFDFLDDIDDI